MVRPFSSVINAYSTFCRRIVARRSQWCSQVTSRVNMHTTTSNKTSTQQISKTETDPKTATLIPLPSTQRIQSLVETLRVIVQEFKIPLFNPLTGENVNRQVALAVLDLDTHGNTKARRYGLQGRNVINLCVAEYLYTHFPNLTLDHLSGALAMFTQRQCLVTLARELGLHMLYQDNLPDKEPKIKIKRASSQPFDAMLEDFDALPLQTINAESKDFEHTLSHIILRLIGGIYEQNGLTEARHFISKHVLQKKVDITTLLESFDPKEDLSKLIHSGLYKKYAYQQIEYVATKDPSSDCLIVKLLVDGEQLASAKAQTKAIGEQKVAQEALNIFYSEYSKQKTPIQREEEKLKKEEL